MVVHDEQDMQRATTPKLDNVATPTLNLDAWIQLACSYPVQWRELIKLFVSKKVQYHTVQCQMGIKTQRVSARVSTQHNAIVLHVQGRSVVCAHWACALGGTRKEM